MYIFLNKTVNAQLTRGIKAASGPPRGDQYSDVSNGVFLDPRDRVLGGPLAVRISLAWRVLVKKTLRICMPKMATFMPFVNSGRCTSCHKSDEAHYFTIF